MVINATYMHHCIDQQFSHNISLQSLAFPATRDSWQRYLQLPRDKPVTDRASVNFVRRRSALARYHALHKPPDCALKLTPTTGNLNAFNELL